MPLIGRVLKGVRKHQMFPRGARVLVALSGGPDSMALLHLLRGLEDRAELTIAGVAHVNHQLRGAEADADEQFCRDTAAAIGLPIEVGRADVASFARESGRSIEDAARSMRYAFLDEAAKRLHADVIAVGHSLNDQAETFLLRLIRGAGSRGLGAIRPRTGKIVRPLLEISRAELRRHAAEHRLRFREDATNRDVRIPRNRVRHELIPVLEQYSPSIVATLARAAEVARQDEEYLESVAIESAASIVLRTERGTEIDVAALNALPPALASRVVRQALAATAPERFFGFDHIQCVLNLASGGEAGESAALPGQSAVRRGGRVVLGQQPEEPFSNFFRFPLSIPGEVAHDGWAVSAQPVAGSAELGPQRARGGEVLVAATSLRGPLAVRNRRPGDRFKPLGMDGRGRKLQDFFVDRKIDRFVRDRLPLVVDQDDRIVWVVGQSVAEDFRVTEPSQGVILLKARRLGGVD
jgi:tRNA(Ile)-lysidine synthase